ncbi:universal stress protein [Picrophilus oshimae]|uniref:Nucleotide-binding universal stress protein, UspA family n=1 Tax=Picrophilus torridus (strain ATCC 700027 / DSM 9790 / JCM 10055 / NBRC 100828 / KAW 2/3) TaxID=1122961 RepID=A0A8G2L7G0_PICTO|nr:universal stress protein [Picrophilus oshimae]SMD30284.1 Nucleotide-binding universal stress protein, UspA family [Picrophilus oshimae DSM 9789]
MKILIAYDDTNGAKEALKYGLKFKKIVDEYIIVYVIPAIVGISASFDSYVPETVYQGQDKTADEILNNARAILDNENVKYNIVKIRSEGDEVSKLIADYAVQNGADMIITGTRKLHGISKLILGSVSSGIIAHSEIPVLVVPPS